MCDTVRCAIGYAPAGPPSQGPARAQRPHRDATLKRPPARNKAAALPRGRQVQGGAGRSLHSFLSDCRYIKEADFLLSTRAREQRSKFAVVSSLSLSVKVDGRQNECISGRRRIEWPHAQRLRPRATTSDVTLEARVTAGHFAVSYVGSRVRSELVVRRRRQGLVGGGGGDAQSLPFVRPASGIKGLTDFECACLGERLPACSPLGGKGVANTFGGRVARRRGTTVKTFSFRDIKLAE